MNFEEPNNPRSCQIINNQVQRELATYEEWTSGFKVQTLENNPVIIFVKTPKTWICENGDIMCMHFTCLRSVFLQSDIANYWSGMHNTVF